MTILKEILEYKKEEVLQQKEYQNIAEIIESAKSTPAPKNFYKTLEEYRQKGKFALIAEVKKASPSKGVIKEDFNHIEIAEIYEKAGAAAISVLTDEKFFQGKPGYLADIREISGLPLLRKDFIIDEYQIYQTRNIGADIILLIASALSQNQLRDYLNLSEELGLSVLLEVHNREEYDFALEAGARLIGINNRDLKTFKVDLQTTAGLIKDGLSKDVFVISESGIKDRMDIEFLKRHGVSGALIGEALMKEEDIETAVNNLIKYT